MAKKTPAQPQAKEGAPTWIDPHLLPMAVPVSSLRLDEENARAHNGRNLTAIRNSLSEFGQMLPLVAREDGTVVVGNGRLSIILNEDLPLKPGGKELGRWDRVAVLRFEGTKEQAQAFSILDNRSGELASWDYEVLSENLRRLQEAEFDLNSLGWEEHEWQPLLEAEWKPDGSNKPKVIPLGIRPAPSRVWVLLGIPLSKFPEHQGLVESLSKDPTIYCEVCGSDKN
jgi:hypothetical protein